MKRQIATLLNTILAAGLALAQTQPSNTLRLGDGTNTDKKIIFNKGSGNPQIRYSATGQSLQFSNDGLNFSDFGSGSGAGFGFNMISKNPDFEQGAANGWTNSGGTYAVVTSGSNLLFGKGSATFTASGVAQYVQSDLYAVPEGLANKSCLARIVYKGGSSSYSLRVLNAASDVLANVAIPSTATVAESLELSFACPTAGTQIRLQVFSTASGPLLAFDTTYMGEAANLSQIAGATFFGSIRKSGCVWTKSDSSPPSNFPNSTGCSVTTTGAAADLADQPGLTFANMPPGTYYFVYTGSFYRSSGIGVCGFRFSDGTNASTTSDISQNANDSIFGGTFSGRISYSAPQTNVSIRVQAGLNGGGGPVECSLNNAPSEIAVYYFPTATTTGYVTPRTQNWSVQANIAGNVTLANAGSFSNLVLGNPALVLTNVPGLNRIPAEIPCDAGTASSGTTCVAAGETVGIAFNLPQAGLVEVCINATHSANNVSSGVGGVLRLVETTNTATTPIQDVGRFVDFANGTAGTTTTTPLNLCSQFEFATAGKKTIRAHVDFSAGGLASNNMASFFMTAKPVAPSAPAPALLSKAVLTPSAGNEKVVRFYADNGSIAPCTGSCTVSRTNGVPTTVTQTGTGAYSFSFSPAPFSAAPVCTCSASQGGGPTGAAACLSFANDSSSGSIVTNVGGSPANTVMFVTCVGPE